LSVAVLLSPDWSMLPVFDCSVAVALFVLLLLDEPLLSVLLSSAPLLLLELPLFALVFDVFADEELPDDVSASAGAAKKAASAVVVIPMASPALARSIARPPFDRSDRIWSAGAT
jgi:hypothetical protein